jgi:hypothetical protein
LKTEKKLDSFFKRDSITVIDKYYSRLFTDRFTSAEMRGGEKDEKTPEQ